MKPTAAELEAIGQVMQTKFGQPNGNCFAACVASITGHSLEECEEAYPVNAQASDFWRGWEKWLGERGYWFAHIEGGAWFLPPKGYAIASGKSPRGEFQHSVVYRNGALIHDPHPDGVGLDGEVKSFFIIYHQAPCSALLTAAQAQAAAVAVRKQAAQLLDTFQKESLAAVEDARFVGAISDGEAHAKAEQIKSRVLLWQHEVLAIPIPTDAHDAALLEAKIEEVGRLHDLMGFTHPLGSRTECYLCTASPPSKPKGAASDT